MIGRLWFVICRIWWAILRKGPPLRTVRVDELPEALDARSVYVVGIAFPWCVAMLCPCGCRHVLHMSLLQDASPRWTMVDHTDGTLSLHPSVWRQVGCRSHFFLRKGRVRWCGVGTGR
jgi:hypothetical protein